jgi:hypothetical protein
VTDSLFGDLPAFPPALPEDELRLLAILPNYGPDETVQEIDQGDEAACRRLERRGLIKVKRWKDDPVGVRRTLYAGRTALAKIRAEDGVEGGLR